MRTKEEMSGKVKEKSKIEYINTLKEWRKTKNP